MNKSDFSFDLPPGLIAQAPLRERSASRMLVVPPMPADVSDHRIRDLPGFLRSGDLLVFNDTRVIPARLFGTKESGGRVEILLERVTGSHEARAQIRASKPPKANSLIVLDEGTRVTVLGRDDSFYCLRFETGEALDVVLKRAGRMPLPPYIERDADISDDERYQTVFAKHSGAVAAPTAGLHFDEPLLLALRDKGVEFGEVTLHVGAGTFQPMRAQTLAEHVMHREWLRVDARLCEHVARVRAAGGRVVAVGTTVVRSLETAMHEGVLSPFEGETQIFIYPGYQIRSVDLLVTNFHLPESTLLMLVSAFSGRERILDAYAHAVREQYRFFSYGDAMLLYPQPYPKDPA
ncbi:MAG: tRNA preQ1(34) S-adenosylmethionine ribosyltransferase-isomerase QueA [Frankiaceae bacterium]|nr:tRNA preQ1(34) S-adenosylmethionine ribosyltransferase-isomerase QueA [Arenimonas sp.]